MIPYLYRKMYNWSRKNIFKIFRGAKLKLEYIVNKLNDGKTVKHIVKDNFSLSTRLTKKLKFGGKILCNNEVARINKIVYEGDIINIHIDFEEESENIVEEAMNLDIIFEDEYFIAINKSPGMVVHPTFNYGTGTVANGLIYYFHKKGEKIKIRPVSRLDRDTTGILIFAKNQLIQDLLVKQMRTDNFIKEYIGVVHGNLDSSSGIINLPIARASDSMIQREVSEEGAPSVTRYEVLESHNGYSILRFILETGRTHQIRVHCKAINHNLIGDTLYGIASENSLDKLINRQALHSHKIKLKHPVTNEFIELIARIPDDIRIFLKQNVWTTD